MDSCDYPGAPEPGLPDGADLAGSRGLEPIAPGQARERGPGGFKAPPSLAPTMLAPLGWLIALLLVLGLALLIAAWMRGAPQ